MAGLVPAIHVGTCSVRPKAMAPPGAEKRVGVLKPPAPCHDVDARDKPGHDRTRAHSRPSRASLKRTPAFAKLALRYVS